MYQRLKKKTIPLYVIYFLILSTKHYVFTYVCIYTYVYVYVYIYIHIWSKGEGKFRPVKAMKTQGGSRDIALLFL